MELMDFVLVWKQFSSLPFPATWQTKTPVQSRYKGPLTRPNILSKLSCAANMELIIFFFSFTAEVACQSRSHSLGNKGLIPEAGLNFGSLSIQMTQLSAVQQSRLERVTETFTAKLFQSCTCPSTPHETALLHLDKHLPFTLPCASDSGARLTGKHSQIHIVTLYKQKQKEKEGLRS